MPRLATEDGETQSPMSEFAGIGLKPAYYAELLRHRPSVEFLEVHTENYMGAGGPPHRYLGALAELYPLSFHGVGLSLGGSEPLDSAHLARWATLTERYGPALVSEHLAWSGHAGYHFHDLLPVPYTGGLMRTLREHIDQVQEALSRQILIENPARYIDIEESEMSETDFLVETARRTGCGLLLDLNNVYVSALNLGGDPIEYVKLIPSELVGEIHLAGHAVKSLEGKEFRIDDHGSEVCEDVWGLYELAVSLFGHRPTLIEWDTNIPALSTLLDQARIARRVACSAGFYRNVERPHVGL